MQEIPNKNNQKIAICSQNDTISPREENFLARPANKKKETKIGQYLEEEAEKRKLSLRALSINAGLNEATVAHIVAGRRKADVDACLKLAQYLRTDPCYLLELAERIPSRSSSDEEQPPWLRNFLYRLTNHNYSKKTIELLEAILDQAEKNKE